MANLVEPAGDPIEARLYERLQRTRAAPQGLCVLNTGGQVLDWALTFQTDRSVLAFLDYSVQRFREHPDAGAPVEARRYQRFPDARMPDVPEEGTAIAGSHPAG